jgi:sugar/nucleoside kinase (ribokinase family)
MAALAERQPIERAVRFAAAAVKCTRDGGRRPS